MDKRKTYYLTIDTETANTIDDALVFDIGGAIHDKDGNVYPKFSYIVDEVFYGMPEVMAECYYQAKLPTYREEIANGSRIVKSLYEIKTAIKDLCEEWNVKAIIAHNARFDYNALNTTQRYTTKSKYRYFLPYGVEIYDTMKMAKEVIATMPTYKKWCEDNGYMTKHRKPRVRVTAEIIHRFISGEEDFIESHTALEDALIEIEIFAYCMRKHKKMRKKLWE